MQLATVQSIGGNSRARPSFADLPDVVKHEKRKWLLSLLLGVVVAVVVH